MEPVSSDKDLINALNTIIPEVYKNQKYKGWKVETIALFKVTASRGLLCNG